MRSFFINFMQKSPIVVSKMLFLQISLAIMRAFVLKAFSKLFSAGPMRFERRSLGAGEVHQFTFPHFLIPPDNDDGEFTAKTVEARFAGGKLETLLDSLRSFSIPKQLYQLKGILIFLFLPTCSMPSVQTHITNHSPP